MPSAAVRTRLAALRFAGEFTEADAVSRNCRLIATAHGADHAPGHIALWLLVDQGGVVADARFRSNAGEDLLAAYDAMVEMTLGRPLTDVVLITPRRVEAFLRGSSPEPAFAVAPDGDQPFFILKKALESFEKPKDGPPTSDQLAWNEIGLFEKVRRIEAVLDQHVRPALVSDGGGLDLVDLQGDELLVQYQGACGSCSSSIGGTLNFIQDSLNNHLGTALKIAVSQLETAEPPSFVN